MDSLEIAQDTLVHARDATNFIKNSMQFLEEYSPIIVPFILIVVLFGYKYFFGNEFNSKSLIRFGLEFPIDFGFVGITLILTFFILNGEATKFGTVMVFIFLIIAMINVFIRNFALKENLKDSPNYYLIAGLGILNAVISIAFIWYILSCLMN